eukprot:TRINITY_DN4552_c0_g1_i2.p1 TRINITY_DN4552_c0_g1~~TRINITY_DN4552_c0_g1_i2.p1  ORF type:complete len:786 (+),score=133.02 TRINITY_DN4552_c0_g1_i2:87-2444(+)
MLAAVLTAAVVSWSGEPIWGTNETRYVYLRKAVGFELGEVVDTISANITAIPHEGRQKLLGGYRLYVNGLIAGVGPGRGECDYTPSATASLCTLFDTIDLTKYSLNNKTGLTLAIQGYYEKGLKGVLADFQISFKSGKKLTIPTDATWSAFDATTYHTPYGSIGGNYVAPRENLIARNHPGSWWSSSFEQTPDWLPATPQLMFATSPKSTLPLHIFEESPAYVQVNNSFAFFDFKREVSAAISLSVSEFNGYVEVTLGEELIDGTQYEILYPMRTGNHYRYVWKAGHGGDSRPSEFFIHENALFRYGMMRFCMTADSDGCTTRDALATRPVINQISALVARYPFNKDQGSFTSNSVMLNNIYDLCSNTIRDTSLDTFTDSHTRERLPYEADGYITSLSRFAVQKGFEWQKHSYRHTFENPTWPTEWRQFTPFMAYSIYMESGDTELAELYWDYLLNSTQARCFNKTLGLIDFGNCARTPGTKDIVDWPAVYRDGYVMTNVNTVINSFTVGSLTVLSRLGRALGKDISELESTADQISTTITTKLFNQSSGLFVDGLDGAENHSAWHAQTNVLWHLGLDEGLKQKLPNLDRIRSFLKEKRITGSVYGVYAFLMGLYENLNDDHGQLALDMITQCDTNSWCHMLLAGATATTEAWSIEGTENLSWSHPWATTALTAIKKGVMGLKPLKPGYSEFIIQPQPGNLTSASAVFPQSVQSSPFRISFENNSSFSLTYSSPAGTSGTACLPVKAGSFSMLLDGKVVKSYSKSTYLCTDNIPAGEHVLKLVPQ